MFVDTEYALLNSTPGDLSSFKWYESSVKHLVESENGDGRHNNIRHNDQHLVFVDIYYVALNFRDVMFAVGQLKYEDLALVNSQFGSSANASDLIGYGLEYVGRRRDNGRFVMSANTSMGRALATTIAADARTLIDVPERLALPVTLYI